MISGDRKSYYKIAMSNLEDILASKMKSIAALKTIIERGIALNLEGDIWLKHTNPWSIWTKFAMLLFLIIAFLFRVWIGWYCLIPIILLVIWIEVNPCFKASPYSCIYSNYFANHWRNYDLPI